MLGRIARKNDAGVLLLAHIDKEAARHGGKGQSFIGTTAWHNSARSRLALIDNDGALELVHEKSNLGPKVPPVGLRFTDGGILVPTGGDPAAIQAGAELVMRGDDAAVLAAMRAALAAGVSLNTARTGPGTAHQVLQTLPELPPALRGSKGRQRFWDALERLRRAGRVRMVDVRDARRHLVKRWEIPEEDEDCASARAR
jgi:hypothetical protein